MHLTHMLHYRQIQRSGSHQRPKAMTVTRYILITIFLALRSWGLADGASGESYVMPKELVQFAEGHGCLQLSEFFDRPGALNPPYVYGYLGGSEEDSAVFWCKKKIADGKPYLLMIYQQRTHSSSSACSQHIEWWNPPGGLSIHQDKSMTLESFIKISDPRQSGPSKQRLEHNAIISSYDGVSVVFYCHNGEWFFRMSH